MDRRTVLTTLVGMGGSVALAPGSLWAAQAPGEETRRLTAPATGQVLNETGAITSNFVGTVTMGRCQTQHGELAVWGNMTGQVIDVTGKVLQSLETRVLLPVMVTQATCEVFEVTLGPLYLERRGLRMHFNPVVVPITADPSGGILGPLLCDLASTTSLEHSRDGLNRLLSLFGSG
jgi:hypothetical protein